VLATKTRAEEGKREDETEKNENEEPSMEIRVSRKYG
jgi:hypothetical protein